MMGDTGRGSPPIIARMPNPSGFTISRGINISHWLSQDFGWAPRDEFLRRADLSTLARLGFDHVRLPIDEKELWLPDGKPNEAEFDRLLTGIGWCRASGLRVIVDLHTIRSHHFNADNDGGRNTIWTDAAAQNRFLDLWRELSARLGHLPPSEVAYEFLNEPVAENDEDWNDLVRKAYELLRELEPNRVCVIGSNRNQQPDFMPTLEVPAGDPNIILSVHNYAPLLLTHYRAYWTSFPAFTGTVQYPGPAAVDPSEWAALRAGGSAKLLQETADATQDWGPERLRRLFAPAIDKARELGLQLYCGEFGCLPTIERGQRLAYYRDVTAVMAEAGMAWAAWEWKGDFGIHTWKGAGELDTPIDEELVELLVSR
jgi:endoglucanase